MIYLKSPSQIAELEYVNKIGAEFLSICFNYIKRGVFTSELEELALLFCERNKVLPAFYGYNGFPHRLCVSINEEVIHGMPGERVIQDGDLVSVDFGVRRGDYVSDAAFTKLVGKGTKSATKLLKVTKECLDIGIEKARPGNRIRDISGSIHRYAIKNGFDVIRDYVGHGVGFNLHEQPSVPNYELPSGVNYKLRSGMVIAIEPMVVEGSYDYIVLPNKWTVITADYKKSAHFEHSVAILPSGPKILSEWG